MWLLKPRMLSSLQWGARKEWLRAFFLRLVQAKMRYGTEYRWFSTCLPGINTMAKLLSRGANIIMYVCALWY